MALMRARGQCYGWINDRLTFVRRSDFVNQQI